MSLEKSLEFFEKIKLNKNQKIISKKIIKEIISRLKFLNNIGLNYLTLNRNLNSLSGGESQRIRLANQIGNILSGVIYILDEPSIGLHQRDNIKLVNTLQSLRDLGNTVIVVEHDEETMTFSDYIIDMGLGSGNNGGNIIYEGSFKSIHKSTKSITAKYLLKKEQIHYPEKRRKITESILIKGKNKNNIKDVSFKIHKNILTCITGVSGSGKSTLINEIIIPEIKK